MAAVNNELVIVSPGGALDTQEIGAGWGFELAGTATQFGFLVTDQINHDIEFQTYIDGSLIDSFVFNNDAEDFPNPASFFESSSAFDEVRFVAGATDFIGGWGIDNLTFGNVSVPEPTTSFLVAAIGFCAMSNRRRRLAE